MLRSWLPLAAVTSLLAAGCGMSLYLQGFQIADHDGRLFVDGVAVDYHREVSLQGALEGELQLRLHSPTANIDLVGGPGETYELVVDLYTEFEDDGEVELDGGELRSRSGLDGKTLINGIRGRLPEGVSLEIHTGTGDVLITSFAGPSEISVESGTGNVQVASCDAERLTVTSGTGDVRASESAARRFKVQMGTGSLAAKDCEFGRFNGDSGTGDFFFQTCRIDTATFNSGVGDVRLTDTLVSEFSSTLGTGQVLDNGTGTP